MKLFKKVSILIIVLLVVLSAFAYIDYFLVKINGKIPILSVKKEIKEKEVIVYSALFYKVWYCTSDKTMTIGSYSDAEVSCSSSYDFVDGYYTNESGIKISKKDMAMLTSQNIYTKEMIEMMSSNSSVNDGIYVSDKYFSSVPKKINNINDKVSLVTFPEFLENNGNYEWIYNQDDESKYYCMKSGTSDYETMYSKYINGKCSEDYNPIKMDDRWCSLYKSSTLINNPDLVKGLCEE